MVFKSFKRTWQEYEISKNHKYVQKGREHNYVEYGVRDEMYMRCKETARCYMLVGNIPMMLNRLYHVIRFEEGGFKYNIR